MGVPVITTRHSGLPEQVLDGQNGFVVDEGDYVALAERILAVAENPDLLPTMGTVGRRHVERFYNSDLLIERQIAVYKRLARGAERSDEIDKTNRTRGRAG